MLTGLLFWREFCQPSRNNGPNGEHKLGGGPKIAKSMSLWPINMAWAIACVIIASSLSQRCPMRVFPLPTLCNQFHACFPPIPPIPPTPL